MQSFCENIVAQTLQYIPIKWGKKISKIKRDFFKFKRVSYRIILLLPEIVSSLVSQMNGAAQFIVDHTYVRK